jgi:hypothetical protein
MPTEASSAFRAWLGREADAGKDACYHIVAALSRQRSGFGAALAAGKESDCTRTPLPSPAAGLNLVAWPQLRRLPSIRILILSWHQMSVFGLERMGACTVCIGYERAGARRGRLVTVNYLAIGRGRSNLQQAVRPQVAAANP